MARALSSSASVAIRGHSGLVRFERYSKGFVLNYTN